jgi:hypothetical protein
MTQSSHLGEGLEKGMQFAHQFGILISKSCPVSVEKSSIYSPSKNMCFNDIQHLNIVKQKKADHSN